MSAKSRLLILGVAGLLALPPSAFAVSPQDCNTSPTDQTAWSHCNAALFAPLGPAGLFTGAVAGKWLAGVTCKSVIKHFPCKYFNCCQPQPDPGHSYNPNPPPTPPPGPGDGGPPPGGGGPSGGGGGGTNGIITGGLFKAATLVGDQGAVGELGGSAATAGDIPGNSPGANALSANLPMQSSRKNSGSGGAGGATTPGAISFGGGFTDPQASPRPTDSGSAEDGLLAYAQSGSGAGSAANGKRGRRASDSDSSADPGGSSSGADFGSAADDNVNPMGSEDPSDYFARIGLGESLFKRVEKRYRAKSMKWAMAGMEQKTRK